ncbi:hypothetical protein, partial [Mesorhizobium sp. M2A.F.Ca.ET.029.05.1.1]|uniref:hypothetical protein n=1 Tax=Mesorhizobium sp. M2A.F.Ca.ET.029.05.1.1 TaxID=2496658 RepID=UPI001FE222B9
CRRGREGFIRGRKPPVPCAELAIHLLAQAVPLSFVTVETFPALPNRFLPCKPMSYLLQRLAAPGSLQAFFPHVAY